MLHIGRNVINGKVIHTFIKSHMRSDFDSLSINIMRNNIPSGVGHKTQEDSLLGICFKLSSSLGWRSNPDAASKSLKSVLSSWWLTQEEKEFHLDNLGHWKSGDDDKKHRANI